MNIQKVLITIYKTIRKNVFKFCHIIMISHNWKKTCDFLWSENAMILTTLRVRHKHMGKEDSTKQQPFCGMIYKMIYETSILKNRKNLFIQTCFSMFLKYFYTIVIFWNLLYLLNFTKPILYKLYCSSVNLIV